MKKLVACLIVLFGISLSAYAADIKIYTDGKLLKTDTPPQNIDNRVLVPMRAIFEALGAEIKWDAGNYSVTARKQSQAIRLKIGSNKMDMGVVNSDNAEYYSSYCELDVAARIINDRTYVPVRAVAEALHTQVRWDSDTETVYIESINEGDGYIFYSSAADYNKLYRVDTNGVNRKKISDRAVKNVKYADGYVYFTSDGDILYRTDEDGENEERITQFATELIGAENGKVYCINKDENALYIIGDEVQIIDNVYNAELHGGYIYYNSSDTTDMLILNVDTMNITRAEMGDGILLAPYNCTFYGKYFLTENGNWYNTIYRFDADGTNRISINNASSTVCENQEEDARVIYISGDNGMSICYTWIDGSYVAVIKQMPQGCVWVDVLAQDGDNIYYKNAFRKEIYRTNFDGTEDIYVAYGDDISIEGDKMFISDDVFYISDKDGQNQRQIYNRRLGDYFVTDNNVIGRDEGFGSIVKIGFNASICNLTNDRASEWTSNLKQNK